MVHAAAEINPTNCFADYPWSSQSNKFWYVVETNSFIHKQLWYSLQDRATVCNIGTQPWTTKQYTLGMGWPTVALQRTTNSYLNTNQVQLLYDVTRTNTITAWTYWSCHPTNQNDVTSHVAIATAYKDMYVAMYTALDAICTNYVPARIGKNMTNWLATQHPKDVPTYCNAGAVLYDAGYSSLVSGVVWSNNVIQSCSDWNFAEYSLPTPGATPHTTETNVFLLSAADCFAACIAQLKYFVVPVIPGRQSDDDFASRQYYDCIGASGSYWGWDALSKKSVKLAPDADYLESYPAESKPLAWAFMAQSMDYTWADGLSRTIDGFDTNIWGGNNSISVSITGTNLNTDWPVSGWYGKATWVNTISASNSSGATSGFRWRLRIGETWYDMDNVKTFNTNITASIEKVPSPFVFSYSETWYSDQQELSSSNYVDAYTNVVDSYLTYYGFGGTTNATGGDFNYYAWTNWASGETFTNLVTYTWFNITKYEFTNTFSTTTDYINQYWKTNGWYKTNVLNAGTTTNTLFTGVSSNVVDGHWEYGWGSNIVLSCDGQWDYGSMVLTNGVYARAILFDVRPNIPIFVDMAAPDPSASDNSQIKYYFLGLSLERAKSEFHLNTTQPILDLPEWAGYNWERPYYNAGVEPLTELDAINTNYLSEAGNWTRTPDRGLPFYPLGWMASEDDWIPFENKKDIDPRYFWGVEKGWCVIDYVFTERKTSLPK